MVFAGHRDDVPELLGIMDVFVTTNGALLTQVRAKELIDAGVSRIHLSVDAYSEESYDKIRHKGYFKKVLDNIHGLIKTRGASKLPIVRL